ncbi:MAG: hypothetical protein KVP17_003298 [Porospora cf. gigantea B]|uniref:uncharacterized protein n=1 Tax=Porospora cf. gigantea B TaxID=2853592 RepID=UPI003571CCB9|nr:MAG: hypothetical protein KVP17_003298 [Porospora cf. gigantea B]
MHLVPSETLLKIVFQCDAPREVETVSLACEVSVLQGLELSLSESSVGHAIWIGCFESPADALLEGQSQLRLRYSYLSGGSLKDPAGDRWLELDLAKIGGTRIWLVRVEDAWGRSETRQDLVPFGRRSKSLSVCASIMSHDTADLPEDRQVDCEGSTDLASSIGVPTTTG